MPLSFTKFHQTIWAYYKENKRDLPWRRTRDPYKILVSEIMLQQTQALRVVSKYDSFIKKFPTTRALAAAKLSDVLQEWQGLGYNRRAIFLKRCAEVIEKDFAGKFPRDFKTLCALPGIGPATAGDIMAFAWNEPVVVIETNIRSVFIHFFFAEKGEAAGEVKKVHDKEILPLIEKTLDRENPREWYWALFDYGAYLKKTANPSQRSVHHAKQSRFEGSFRQKRAAVLRAILAGTGTEKKIQDSFNYKSDELAKVLTSLEKDGFIKKTRGGKYEAV
jgi:A/G-specific adenine glycosylase